MRPWVTWSSKCHPFPYLRCWKQLFFLWSGEDNSQWTVPGCLVPAWHLMHGWTTGKFSVTSKYIIEMVLLTSFQRWVSENHNTVIFFLLYQARDWIAICSCFPWNFTPGLLEETGLEIQVAICKNLEAKCEKVAELLTQHSILRLTDLLVISAKVNLTCEANMSVCCHHHYFTHL